MAKKKDEEEKVVTMSEDEVMPKPKVKEYEKFVKVNDKFRKMMNDTLGVLGYNQNIGTPETQIQVNKLFKVIEDHGDKMSIQEMNQFIMLMSLAPYNVISPMMKLIEDPQKQSELWEIIEA